MMPVQRDYEFDLPASRLPSWHPDGAAVSHFFNALSLFFPPGERFFIGSVRNYRACVADAGLKREVKAFIGQEAMHGREHEAYNRLLADAGLPAAELERLVKKVLDLVQKAAPNAWQLSATIALEHFTAILADNLLGNERMLRGAQEQYRQLWLWHALEETEHKAVAYDVWRQAMGSGVEAYVVRCGGMLITSAAFVALVAAFSTVLIEKDASKRAKPRGLAAYRPLAGFLLGRDGLLRKGFPAWLDYFRADFHPWQHDNRRLLRRLKEITPAQQQRTQLAHAA
jgi:uncharacterized protein